MKILDALLASLPTDAPVQQSVVGARWTAVVSRTCGLASRLPSACSKVAPIQPEEKGWEGHSARKLAGLVHSADLGQASLGLAALNSLLPVDADGGTEANASEVLAEVGRDRKVAVVGHFPFTLQLQKIARRVWVLELRPGLDDLPADRAAEVLPQAEVVAFSATTLINHTLEDLGAQCRPDSFKMMLGPSTPLSPVLFDYGFQALAGAVVMDVEEALQAIRSGESFRQVKRACRLITLRRG
jgi:uncharacterized protein (DUF4213/DUF364 family)